MLNPATTLAATAPRSHRRSGLLLALLLLIALAACSTEDNGLVEPGVIVTDVTLPVAGASYRGVSEHVFAGGQVALFCGGHGTFTSSVSPPQAVGQTVVSEYTATFQGELVLRPPVVASTVTHALSVQARMAESIRLSGDSGGVLTFDTELLMFTLEGTEMPDGIRVRESPTLASSGVTTVTPLSGGRSNVQSRYDVWLEISLDEGRSWEVAEDAVRMTLEPS